MNVFLKIKLLVKVRRKIMKKLKKKLWKNYLKLQLNQVTQEDLVSLNYAENKENFII